MANIIVLGAQWGDEGKGKLVDFLSGGFDIVARYQGGHNAGHTVYLGDKRLVLKLIPSGVLRPGKIAVIGNGLVVDPLALMDEMGALQAAGLEVEKQLRISNRAHVIFPLHRLLEKVGESRPDRAIGTTSRGIGPAYESKMGRRGLRMADLIDSECFESAFALLAEDIVTTARAFGLQEDADLTQIRHSYRDVATRLRPMICDTCRLLNQAIDSGKHVLFEGAQGSMLDVDHGTYPYVTSSSSTAGGACTGTGVPPTKIHGTWGVSKAYITRVGGGPFATEDQGPAGDNLRKLGNEFGAVTGRPRRCGWFDVPLLRYTAMVNGFEGLIITKLDVLDTLEQIPVCVGYEIDGQRVEEMPATVSQLARIQPVYENLPGWQTSTTEVRSANELPGRARDYLRFLEQQTGVEIGCVSTGPGREQTFLVPGTRMEKVLKTT
jgi:adenylosuccinate synthase